MRKSRGFTFVELLTVLAVIAILATLIAVQGTVARQRARIGKAKAQIAALESALSAYELDMGSYPGQPGATTHESSNPFITQQLTGLSRSDGSYIGNTFGNEWNGPYVMLKSEDFNSSRAFVDPWGHAFDMSVALDANPATVPPSHNPLTFDISSSGPSTDAVDDITNYPTSGSSGG